LSARISLINSLVVNRPGVQIFFVGAIFFISSTLIFAQPETGEVYRINLSDVDGNTFSTANGRVTVMALTSQANIDKARLVADRIPDFCLGNPNYRMITILVFEKNHSRPVRAVMSAMVRQRLNSEGQRLQSRYDQLKVNRDARKDVSAVADFGGSIANQLGLKPGLSLFQVFVFGKNGELMKHWKDVPSAEELAAALTRSH
jgi:hypothetical protein